MMQEIGESAGVVWNYLKENHGATAEQIAKSSKIKNGLLFMAIGWLAREGKIEFENGSGQHKIKLISE